MSQPTADTMSDVAYESGLECAGVHQRGFGGDWAVGVRESHNALLHCVVRGGAVLTGVGEPTWLGTGNIAVLPHSVPHTLASNEETAEAGAEELPDPADGEVDSTAVDDLVETVVLTMPFVLAARQPDEAYPIQPILRVLDVPHPEVIEMTLLVSKLCLLPGPGDRYVARRLAEAVLTKVVVQLAGPEEDRFGVFGMFASQGVKAALAAVQGNLAHPWSVGELADIAGMGRRRFVAEFRDVVGTGVQDYVQLGRIRQAEELVRRGAAKVGDVAEAVGFRSQAAFARAFKRVTGHAVGH